MQGKCHAIFISNVNLLFVIYKIQLLNTSCIVSNLVSQIFLENFLYIRPNKNRFKQKESF